MVGNKEDQRLGRATVRQVRQANLKSDGSGGGKSRENGYIFLLVLFQLIPK